MMFIPEFKQICLILLLVSPVTQAQNKDTSPEEQTKTPVYKWIDPTEVTNYSQTEPKSGQAQKLDLPSFPPPAEDAAQEIQKVKEQINKDAEHASKQQQENEKQLAKDKQKQQHCQTLTETLTAYQNNPNRRMYDEEGNTYRLTETERQETINDLQQYLDSECK